MKQIATIFLFLFFCSSFNGQTNVEDYSSKIKRQAKKMGKLLLKGNFASFSNYTYPAIVEKMGGKEKMVEILKKGTMKMKSEGTAFLKVSFGEPSKIISIENELQCTMPQSIEMKVPNGKLISNSTLIAISLDNGKKWYFVDTSGKDIQTMKKLLPNLSSELIIPNKSQPIFYPK